MSLLLFRTRTYARNVYLYGNTKLSDISTSPDDYSVATMQYAASEVAKDDTGVITRADIDTALEKGWLTQQEYDATISLISAQ